MGATTFCLIFLQIFYSTLTHVFSFFKGCLNHITEMRYLRVQCLALFYSQYNLTRKYYCWSYHNTAMVTANLHKKVSRIAYVHVSRSIYIPYFLALYFSPFLYFSVLSCLVLVLLSVIERISLPCVSWSLSVSPQQHSNELWERFGVMWFSIGSDDLCLL